MTMTTALITPTRPRGGQVWRTRVDGGESSQAHSPSSSSSPMLVHVLDVVPVRLSLIRGMRDRVQDEVLWRTLRTYGPPLMSSTALTAFDDQFEFVGEYDARVERSGQGFCYEPSVIDTDAMAGLGSQQQKIVPDWDEYFLGIAQAASLRGKCTRRQVGACVVDENRDIVSLGYNGAPRGMLDCLQGGCPRGRSDYSQVAASSDYSTPGSMSFCTAIHAEGNALAIAGVRARGATMFINHPSCPDCLRRMAGAGIARAVWPDPERPGESVSVDPAHELARMAGLSVAEAFGR